MKKKSKLREFIDNPISLATQLHSLRITKRLSIKEVAEKTRIPLFIIDSLEIGNRHPNIGQLGMLAAFYNKKIQIKPVDKT